MQKMPTSNNSATTSCAIANILSEYQAAGTTPSGFRFLDLPADIRVMTYEEVVVVGKVFYTPNYHELSNGKRCEDYERFRKPDLSLLRVCKQIHREAEAVYLSRNMFVLPVRWGYYHPFDGIEPAVKERYLFSIAGLSLIKNVSLAVDQEQLTYYSMNSRDWEYERKHNTAFDHLSHRERLNLIHDGARDWSRQEWYQLLVETLGLFESPLQYLEVDFTNAFCTYGCCRPLARAIHSWIVDTAPKSLEVIGYREDEKSGFSLANVREHYYSYRFYAPTVLKQHSNLRFRTLDDVTEWDVWKL